MTQRSRWQSLLFSDNAILILLFLLRFLPLVITNGQTGWHRDELDTLESARHLAWGYVAYPPLAPFVARVALNLFGPSLAGVRLFSTLAQATACALAGLTARELGGRRWAQVVAFTAAAIGPYALLAGSLFHYSSFDSLWWVLIAYLTIRLIKSDDPRWWLGIGAVVGLGLMTKYTIAFLAAGMVVGVLLTRIRRHLLSPWLWAGVALALLIVLPNLIWQMQHGWIAVEFTKAIHARDVRMGRSEGYLKEQFLFAANIATVPLWLAGLYYYFLNKLGRSYRLLGYMFVVPFLLFLVTQGRSYYIAPAYPLLLAAGAVVVERWLSTLSAGSARLLRAILWAAFAVGGVGFALIALPIAPVNSRVWEVAIGINGELGEQIGWPELAETVAGIYKALPAEERLHTGILTGNYGELGAINLYGPAYGLPQAISGVNSYWLRGYGDPAPQTLIVIGLPASRVQPLFQTCRPAGRITNRYGVRNDEVEDNPAILLCRGLQRSWEEFWPRLRSFG